VFRYRSCCPVCISTFSRAVQHDRRWQDCTKCREWRSPTRTILAEVCVLKKCRQSYGQSTNPSQQRPIARSEGKYMSSLGAFKDAMIAAPGFEVAWGIVEVLFIDVPNVWEGFLLVLILGSW
jgi:hypothetical protein